MLNLDATNSECFVYTYREGLFSAVGHDLKLQATDFTITVDEQGSSLRADFRTDSLRVVGAVKKGRLSEDEPAPQDKREIETAIVRDILEARKYPLISFCSTAMEKSLDGYRVTGWLALHGVKKEIAVKITRQSGRVLAEASIHQPDFHITPFRTFLGVLRVKPEVRVVVTASLAVD